MRRIELNGEWICEIPGQRAPIWLPGTLDENGIGVPDDPEKQWKAEEVRRIGFWKKGDPIVTRLTRRHTFEGEARISRTVRWDAASGMRVFADVERARFLRLLVNGREARPCRPGSLSTPYSFEITGLANGTDEFTFLSDNSYPDGPKQSICYSSAASDETQTNWNGLLGRIQLREERDAFISGVRVYPRGGRLDVCVEMDAARAWHGTVRIESDALTGPASAAADILPGNREIWFRGLEVSESARRWDLDEGVLHALKASGEGLEERTVSFGIREFTAENGRLQLNGRRVFLRGETNCAVLKDVSVLPEPVVCQI